MDAVVQIIATLQTWVPATTIINGGGCDIRGGHSVPSRNYSGNKGVGRANHGAEREDG